MQSFDFIVFGGGTILMSPEYTCSLVRAIDAGVPIFAFGSGWSKKAHEPFVAVSDSTFRESIRESLRAHDELRDDCVLSYIASHAHGGVRGPISMQAILENAAARDLDVEKVQKRLSVLGDAGMLYPLHDAGKMGDGLKQALTFDSSADADSKRPLIAVNYGYNKGKGEEFILHDDHLVVAQAYATMLSMLAATGKYDIVVYAIQGSDLPHLDGLRQLVTPNSRIRFVMAIFDATSMFEILSMADYCINYKLHASISCFHAGPVGLEVVYSRKYFDWAAHVPYKAAMSRFVVKTNELGADGGNILFSAFEALVSKYGGRDGDKKRHAHSLARARAQARTQKAYATSIDDFLRLVLS